MSEPTTLREKIADFFRRNPDEELTADDVAAKFDVNREMAVRMIRSMRNAGELRTENRKPALGGREHVVAMGEGA